MSAVPIVLYLAAFFSTVVVNCAKPVNWENCSRDLDAWLIPEIRRAFHSQDKSFP